MVRELETALNRNLSPAMVAEYLTKLIPREKLQPEPQEIDALAESTTEEVEAQFHLSSDNQ